MTLRVHVAPALLVWACQRNGKEPEDYAHRFVRLSAWIAGDEQPTYKQLEQFAAATHTPIGCFFLDTPPDETLPIEDFRTVAGARQKRPSPELMDTLAEALARQDWYREFCQSIGEGPLHFVGRASLEADPADAARQARALLSLDGSERATWSGPDEAARDLVARLEKVGVLVMRNGIVGSNTHRKLELREFRGFTLVDRHAPLIFVNTTDAKAGQVFTLAHELGHVWLGRSGVSDEAPNRLDGPEVERWCNAFAAELLVPLADLRAELRPGVRAALQVARLAKRFGVSKLVLLRRLYDAGGLTRAELERLYAGALASGPRPEKRSGKGDYYTLLSFRLGHLFPRAVIASALEGKTLMRDAYKLLGVQKTRVFEQLSAKLEMG